ncbi:PREDICTED: GRF1-interacting factor 3-like [Tarenaya hassleriana]|uniref:GRF1-interacting factor 3-like n=1 Tax=Tarenaya hassleriana TaxID=28532 RepID=UPI00053C6ABA|nr:PREDICTED: GRF1-interacting factor 3-like [Tarenaya hassleriana]
MQQPPQMIPMVPSFPPTNITTEQIQKYLDENKKLIMAILENQNLGKLAECAQYQALLQKNLMYLHPHPSTPAAPAVASQMATHAAMQPPGYFMQHPQAGAMPQPAGLFPPRGMLQFNSPHPLQEHPHAMQGHIGNRPIGINNNGLQQHSIHHPESALGSGGNVGQNEARGGSKQDGTDSGAGQSGGDGQGGDGK